MAKIVIRNGDKANAEIEFAGPTIIGRKEGVAVQLNDGKVSREHARIFPQGPFFYVEDLRSTNGTWVNGARVQRAKLASGDKIKVGQTEMEVVLPAGQKRINIQPRT